MIAFFRKHINSHPSTITHKENSYLVILIKYNQKLGGGNEENHDDSMHTCTHTDFFFQVKWTHTD